MVRDSLRRAAKYEARNMDGRQGPGLGRHRGAAWAAAALPQKPGVLGVCRFRIREGMGPFDRHRPAEARRIQRLCRHHRHAPRTARAMSRCKPAAALAIWPQPAVSQLPSTEQVADTPKTTK